MKRGRFITFEGGEGVGKSTQTSLLATALRASGLEVECTREPGGTPGAEAIRALLLRPENGAWGTRAEALLFAAARADHVEKHIRPLLARGVWVVCDRYIDSSRAYQGGGGGLDDEEICKLHQLGSEGLMPDLTILLEGSPDIIMQRITARDQGTNDAISGRDHTYHARVASAFRKFAEAEPARFCRISADGTPQATHHLVMAAVSRLIRGAP